MNPGPWNRINEFFMKFQKLTSKRQKTPSRNDQHIIQRTAVVSTDEKGETDKPLTNNLFFALYKIKIERHISHSC